MESVIDTTFSNPVYMAIAGVLIIMLVYALIKKSIKLVFTVGVILILYVVYLNYTGQEVLQTSDELKESFSETLGKGKEKASELLEEAKESTKKIVEEKVEDKIDEILGN